MSKKECERKKKLIQEGEAKYICKECKVLAKKEEKLCKPKKIKS